VLTVAITLMVLAVVLTSVLATLLYRNISNGLSHIENTIEQVSRQQDFRLRAKADSQDEIGRTASAFNRLLESLQQAMRQLGDGSRQVNMRRRSCHKPPVRCPWLPVRKARHRPILPPPSSR
jgi:methyl-accepting chemotaxis protein